MIKLSTLKSIVELQRKQISQNRNIIARDIRKTILQDSPSHALIVAGIRRCGKSTLMGQLIKEKKTEKNFFINFDTPRLYNFDINDFEILDIIIKKGNYNNLFFDEIQVVKGWELYIRQKLDEGFSVTVTGSNASLLSRELGTKLTGRHITKELFPFSYQEFLYFNSIKPGAKSFKDYLFKGGFPEYLKTNNPDILQSLLEDILFRDIAVRYSIRDVDSLKRLMVFLVSNTGGLLTANKLTKKLSIKSSATVLEYLSFLEQSYMLNLLPRFSYSYRSQIVNPRKIYIIDNGLIDAVSASFSDNLGRKFENAVYWFLRQKNKELYYFNESGNECDFVIYEKKKAQQLIQVCADLNVDNSQREQNGIFAAMDYFNLKTGIILTINQTDIIKNKSKTVNVLPAYKYFSKNIV